MYKNIVWWNISLSSLNNVYYQFSNHVLWVLYCFVTSCWLAHNQLSWNVLLFSCNPIWLLCLGGPSYSMLHCKMYTSKLNSSCLHLHWFGIWVSFLCTVDVSCKTQPVQPNFQTELCLLYKGDLHALFGSV